MECKYAGSIFITLYGRPKLFFYGYTTFFPIFQTEVNQSVSCLNTLGQVQYLFQRRLMNPTNHEQIFHTFVNGKKRSFA